MNDLIPTLKEINGITLEAVRKTEETNGYYERLSKRITDLNRFMSEFLEFKAQREQLEKEIEKKGKNDKLNNKLELAKANELGSRKRVEMYENEFRPDFIAFQIELAKCIADSCARVLEEKAKAHVYLSSAGKSIAEYGSRMKYEEPPANQELIEELNMLDTFIDQMTKE